MEHIIKKFYDLGLKGLELAPTYCATTIYFFLVAVLLSIIMFSLAFFLSISNVKDSEKLSEYECGFEPFDQATRHPFDVHFYVVGILFLIFDVEIAILFP
jgi:NADH-quinone oxidoreductase subunit A